MIDLVQAIQDKIRYRRDHNFHDVKEDSILWAIHKIMEIDKDEINELYNSDSSYFHKAFRQTGVLCYSDNVKTPENGGKLDGTLHSLIGVSELFWEVFEELKTTTDDRQ